ncbi:NADPH-dependent F420 reductase [Cellulomonas cellasea]|uniref:3-hydroxyisobutyrate dehydrogenase n=2 Tax=Cellulomonas cellasea TaxID=43670 RepID=A0A0A0BEZ2_9CELL|nr:NAD(P)-binding domain-containing protein [Cellulomonas cellasea]KGM03901.1 3-hydroxyisobutyrate dehydrogenase [Cellulomonas cellasea DSM 20118]GEA87324.1 3-hydroxyisobutyrate dehydrogenase [Cellulomonas cellasea]
MRIGIIGAGNIGTILARRLARVCHDVSIANSRAPETVPAAALSTGARAVWAADATAGADVVIVSVNLGQIPTVADLVAKAPSGAVVLDTSNYFPHRDGVIEGLGAGQNESAWVQAQYRRPLVKVWNTITTASFADKATPVGAPGRIALPVAADDDAQREVGMELVEQTGFDAFDAGVIADSWRQQPGTPAYTTDLTAEQLPAALAAADAARAARRRDLMMEILLERAEPDGTLPGPDFQLASTRLLF